VQHHALLRAHEEDEYPANANDTPFLDEAETIHYTEAAWQSKLRH
jgi:hypothetical protein